MLLDPTVIKVSFFLPENLKDINSYKYPSDIEKLKTTIEYCHEFCKLNKASEELDYYSETLEKANNDKKHLSDSDKNASDLFGYTVASLGTLLLLANMNV